MTAKKKAPADGLPQDYVSLEDLHIAYRKAKVDTFYGRELFLSFEFIKFEDDLENCLKQVRAKLLDESWIQDAEVLGGLSYIPKSLDFEAAPNGEEEASEELFASHSVHTDSQQSWEARVSEENRKGRDPVATFRPMPVPSVEWLVISAFWILKAGHKLDSCLSEDVRGARLRTLKNKSYFEDGFGSFAPYAPAYSSWRREGLEAIRNELNNERRCVGITADLRSFYHSIDCSFLDTESFRQAIKTKESELREEDPDFPVERMNLEDWEFTRQMMNSLLAWSKLHQQALPNKKAVGLPIGLGASRVIANLSLIAFDEFIRNELEPIYYGRYVDDVFMVLRSRKDVTTSTEAWKRLTSLSSATPESVCRLQIEVESDTNAEKVCRLYLDYDSSGESGRPRSNLRFGGSKQKTFFIEGTAGKTLIDTIDQEIKKNGSEWRLLPSFHNFGSEAICNFITASTDTTESADSLRKADQFTVQRLKFALHLRDLEAFSEDLESSSWKEVREELYGFTRSQLISLPDFFVYARYIPRVFSIAILAREWEPAQGMLKRLGELFELIESEGIHRGKQSLLTKARQDMGIKLAHALCQSAPMAKGKDNIDDSDQEDLGGAIERIFGVPAHKARDLARWSRRFYVADLGRHPFKHSIVDGSVASDSRDGFTIKLATGVGARLKVEFGKKFLKCINYRRKNLPRGVVFPTRPLSPGEIGLLNPDLLSQDRAKEFGKVVRSLRGTHFSALDDEYLQKLKDWNGEGDSDPPIIWIPDSGCAKEIRICMPCITTGEESWAASIVKKADPDLERYARVTDLINTILRQGEKPDYIVLPELSLKRSWFKRFAHKLEKSGVSLISGVEYAHHPHEGIGKNQVVNSAQVSLVTKYPGYRTHLLYAQNKKRPAPGEEVGLFKIGGKSLAEGKSERKIIRHGDFQFALLICSELSDIEARSALRGKIDALFVPEWNKDTGSFASLVESSAIDLHCYVVQSNNRCYGDSRVRGPFKETWQRNVLRLQGGAEDFYATGKIDYEVLRRFQSCHRSPTKPFKPVPDGFEIHPSRKAFPLIEKQD